MACQAAVFAAMGAIFAAIACAVMHSWLLMTDGVENLLRGARMWPMHSFFVVDAACQIARFGVHDSNPSSLRGTRSFRRQGWVNASRARVEGKALRLAFVRNPKLARRAVSGRWFAQLNP